MSVNYNYKAIEQKWTKKWAEHPINKPDPNKKKYYCLDMFPYPSANGLHVGHWRGYVISDVWSRYKLMQGYYLIHPMGWDAFGLPAENYAIKMGTHPAATTKENIKNIKRQIEQIAAIYDWDMEVNTTDPAFYKWTQWIFVKMFKEGLAYEKEMPINWCPSCKTGARPARWAWPMKKWSTAAATAAVRPSQRKISNSGCFALQSTRTDC